MLYGATGQIMSLKGAREEPDVPWLLFLLPCRNTGRTCSPQVDGGAVTPGQAHKVTVPHPQPEPCSSGFLPEPDSAQRAGHSAGAWHQHTDGKPFSACNKAGEATCCNGFSLLSGKKGCVLLGL